ncbi:XdhC family protein [Candidatus Poseidonia alphae]|nr:XdhC family protein [Candidatus Poseidonia alphae]
MTARVLQWALSRLNAQHKVVLATVLNTSGSVPGKTGARLAMTAPDLSWEGTVGGGWLGTKGPQPLQNLARAVDNTRRRSGDLRPE